MRPTGGVPTVAPVSTSPTPFPSGVPSSGPIAPLQPGQILLLSDRYSGSTDESKPQDFDGNVNLFYDQGVIVSEHAHYDGSRYLDFTGHPYLRNYSGDTVLSADLIRFDKFTQRATLFHGTGDTPKASRKASCISRPPRWSR